MNAREKILGNIRNAQSRSGLGKQAESVSTYLARHSRGPLPPRSDDLVACFKEKAVKLSNDVMQTNALDEIPALLSRYLNERELPIPGTQPAWRYSHARPKIRIWSESPALSAR